MIEYSLWPRVERIGPGHYVARVSAIPCGIQQRCAPEERAQDCASHEEARAAAAALARDLARDLRARGIRLMQDAPVRDEEEAHA